ncbi:hypothetical protein D3C72_1068440 [compost metagenome]
MSLVGARKVLAKYGLQEVSYSGSVHTSSYGAPLTSMPCGLLKVMRSMSIT